jgi:hypothetical protein
MSLVVSDDRITLPVYYYRVVSIRIVVLSKALSKESTPGEVIRIKYGGRLAEACSACDRPGRGGRSCCLNGGTLTRELVLCAGPQGNRAP